MDDDLRRLFEETTAESRRHFDVVAERIESKLEMVAEGVTVANERIDRLEQRMDGLDQRMDRFEQRMDRFEGSVMREFAEVRSMIKFSHAEVDRRLRELEESHRSLLEIVSHLQARVDRLESTH